MLSVLNIVFGVLGFIGFLFYSGLLLLVFMLSPLVGNDKLPYFTVALVLCLTALMTCTLGIGVVAGVVIIHEREEGQKLAMVTAGITGILAMTVCFILTLSQVIPDRDSLAKLAGPAVAVAALYCGLTLAVWLRDLIRSTSPICRRNRYGPVTPARLGIR